MDPWDAMDEMGIEPFFGLPTDGDELMASYLTTMATMDEPNKYPKPDIVKAAESGNFAELDKLILGGADVNARQHWEEVEPKYGYCKSWDWFGDTALIAAALRGDAKMVRRLLLAGADPLLQSMHSEDDTLDVAKAVERCREQEAKQPIKAMLDKVMPLWKAVNSTEVYSGVHYTSDPPKNKRPSYANLAEAL